jgi:membrane-associated phospholipid phosphatase
MKHPGSFRVIVAIALASLPACRSAPDADPKMVSEWMRTLFGAIRVERLSPPVASRLMAYASTALYAGLASASRALPPLEGALNGLPALPGPEPGQPHDGALTAIAAERVVLDSLLWEALPTTRAALAGLADSLQLARVADGMDDRVRARSEELGRRIGYAIVAWSRADGFDATRGRRYAAPIGPGLWVNDAPAPIYAAQNLSGASSFVALDNPANLLRAGSASDRGLILNRPKPAVATLPVVNMTGTSEPYWGEIRPFVLLRWDECPIPAPPPYSADSTSTFFMHAKAVRDVRATLTPEQRTIALYWADNAGESGTPVGHWIAIASQMVSARSLSAEEAARLVMLTAVAQADAFIASWGFKYEHSVLRPRTYIRRLIDSAWEPLIPTPPFPEYPSGHSTQSAAAATVIAALLGDVPFEDSSSVSIGHSVRRFESFTAAAAEAGASRIYGGIHYPFANDAGRALGQCIGARAIERVHDALQAP